MNSVRPSLPPNITCVGPLWNLDGTDHFAIRVVDIDLAGGEKEMKVVPPGERYWCVLGSGLPVPRSRCSAPALREAVAIPAMVKGYSRFSRQRFRVWAKVACTMAGPGQAAGSTTRKVEPSPGVLDT